MNAASRRPLTRRQMSVMDRIDRRVPIKVIASELGVSETRVNQHIRALKDFYRADSLNELVEHYRAGGAVHGENPGGHPLRNTAYNKKQIEPADESLQHRSRNDGLSQLDHGLISEDRKRSYARDEPQVVPGVLDGKHAVLFRLLAIVAIAFGILAAVVLAVTAAMTLSEALDGKAHVPVEQ